MELVEGFVVLDGKPVEGATVFFSPVASAGEGAAGLPAAGRTGFDGGFRLNAGGGAKPGAGTAVGDYIVTVIKQESDALPPPDLNAPPPLSASEIRERMSGNLCRCAAYPNIIAAIQDVSGIPS